MANVLHKGGGLVVLVCKQHSAAVEPHPTRFVGVAGCGLSPQEVTACSTPRKVSGLPPQTLTSDFFSAVVIHEDAKILEKYTP